MSEPKRMVWLVDGDDPTLVGEAVRSLVDDLVGDAERSLVVEDHRGDEVDLAAVADACRTPPFLADRRVVVVRDVGRWNTEELAPLLGYLDEPLGSTALVLVAGGGRPAPKLLAAVKARGHITGTAVGRDAKGWIRDRIRSSPLALDAAATQLVEAHLGEDVSRLGAMLDVLTAAFGEGARLGPGDLGPYLGEAGAAAPWDLTDAIDAGRTEVAIDQLHRMLGAGERHPLVVLATLARHVGSILRVDADGVTTEAQAAAAMGITGGRSTFPARKALASARRLGPAGVAEAIGLVADAEVDLKGGSEWPGELVLEVLVARLCRLSRAGAGVRSGGRR
jgi:DNA polymerase-3 subunit delta